MGADPRPAGSPTAVEAAGSALDRLTRLQPDFPLPGVLFRDLTPVLADSDALAALAAALPSGLGEFDLVAGLEARGFLLAAAVATAAGRGVLAVRKPGKLPGGVFREDYELEYGSAAMELHPDDIPSGARVLVVDDVLATGGTAAAACRLIIRAGGCIAGLAVAIELTGLGGRSRLTGTAIRAIRSY